MSSIIKKCNNNCPPHEFQDNTYGKGMRVMNLATKKGSKDKPVYRCTICGKET